VRNDGARECAQGLADRRLGAGRGIKRASVILAVRQEYRLLSQFGNVHAGNREMRAGHHVHAATEAIAFIIVRLRKAASVTGGNDILLRDCRENEVIGMAELREAHVHDGPQ
jgi:hypothetical protein